MWWRCGAYMAGATWKMDAVAALRQRRDEIAAEWLDHTA